MPARSERIWIICSAGQQMVEDMLGVEQLLLLQMLLSFLCLTGLFSGDYLNNNNNNNNNSEFI